MKKLFLLSALVLIFTISAFGETYLFGRSYSDPIYSIVKDGYIPGFNSMTIGEAFQGYFDIKSGFKSRKANERVYIIELIGYATVKNGETLIVTVFLDYSTKTKKISYNGSKYIITNTSVQDNLSIRAFNDLMRIVYGIKDEL